MFKTKDYKNNSLYRFKINVIKIFKYTSLYLAEKVVKKLLL